MNFVQLIVRTVAYFRPLKVFLPLSLFLLLGCVVALIYRTIIGEGMAIVITLLFISSIQMLGTGLLADMLARHMHSEQRSSRVQSSVVRYEEETVDG
jgi:hypothetical protein